MDVLLILLMAVSLVVLVGEPLVRRLPSSAQSAGVKPEIEQLALHKETLYMALRDLDFDFHTGKVDQKDYTELRYSLETEALHVLRRMDEVDPLAVLDNELERQILAMRQVSQTSLAPPGVCFYCGITLQGDENFCPACGQALTSS